jgi:signal transduction histidine kinase
MLTTLTSFLAIPKFDDRDKARTARFLNTTILVIMAATVPVIVLDEVLSNRILVAAALVVFLFAFWLIRRDKVTLAGYIVTATLLVVLTKMTALGHGIRDAGMLGFCLVVTLSGLFVGPRAIFPFAGLSMLIVLGIHFIERFGLVTTPFGEYNLLPDAIYIAMQIGMFSVLLRMIMTSLTNSLKEARENERRAEEARLQVTRLNEELEQRVEARTQDLRVALERAEEADRIKSQFLASMSHELRTPLNAILTFNELLAMGTFGEVNEEQVNYLQKSLNSGRHLLSLINDVLDITKIQSGMMSLFIEEGFDVVQELTEIVASAERMLNGKAVRLVTDIDREFPPLTCDKRRVRQVLLNLIGNAVKFTEEGTITVSAKMQDSQVLFAIIDTGPGIPKDQQDIVFEPFVQTEEGIKHAGGTGLGLPISKRLTEAHGGRLWVESAPGEGAAFYAAFPLAQKASAERAQ